MAPAKKPVKAKKGSSVPVNLASPFATLAGKLTCFKDNRVIGDDFEEVVFPTSSVVLDNVLRLGGIPFNGRLIHIHGKEGSGKSTIGYSCIAAYQRSGIGNGYAAIWDWEGTCTPKYLRALGVDSSKVAIIRVRNTSEALRDAYLLAKEGVRLHMIDSIAEIKCGSSEQDILGGKALKTRVGQHAKMVSEFFNEYIALALEFDLCTIAINQTRSRIDTSFEGQAAAKFPSMTNLPYELPGGKRPRFLSSIMLEATLDKEYYGAKAKDHFLLMEPEPKVKNAPIANKVKVRVLKNKVNAGGFRKGHLWTRPGKGIDDLISIRELAVHYDLVSFHAGKGWRVGAENNQIHVYKTKEELIEALIVNPDMDVMARLREQVVEAVMADNEGSQDTLSEDERLLIEDVPFSVDEVEPDEENDALLSITGLLGSKVVADDEEDDGL